MALLGVSTIYFYCSCHRIGQRCYRGAVLQIGRNAKLGVMHARSHQSGRKIIMSDAGRLAKELPERSQLGVLFLLYLLFFFFLHTPFSFENTASKAFQRAASRAMPVVRFFFFFALKSVGFLSSSTSFKLHFFFFLTFSSPSSPPYFSSAIAALWSKFFFFLVELDIGFLVSGY